MKGIINKNQKHDLQHTREFKTQTFEEFKQEQFGTDAEAVKGV